LRQELQIPIALQLNSHWFSLWVELVERGLHFFEMKDQYDESIGAGINFNDIVNESRLTWV